MCVCVALRKVINEAHTHVTRERFLLAVLGALSDSIGRRPMIVWGGLIDALTFFLWGTITNAAAWICVSVLMAFDGSGLTSNTILVDAAVVLPATRIGGPQDWWITRFSYYYGRPTEYDLDKQVLSTELNCAFIVTSVYGIFGLIFGVIVGDLVYTIAGLHWGMCSAGFIMLFTFFLMYRCNVTYVENIIITQQPKIAKLI